MTSDDAATAVNSSPLGAEVNRRAAAKATLSGIIHRGIALIYGPTAREGMLSLVDQAVASATNFMTGVIIGRACTKEEFGLYMLGFTIVNIAMDVQISLVGTPYMIYGPRFKDAAHALYTGSSLILQLGLCALVMLALAVLGVVMSLGFGPQGLAQVVWALVVALIFILLREYARRVCFAQYRMKTALVVDLCVAVGQIGGLLLLAHLGVLSASRAYLVIGGASAIAAIGWLVWTHKQFTLQLRQATLDLRCHWYLGKWIFASSLLWCLGLNLYPWILTGFHGTSSAGAWAASLGVVALGNPLLFGVQNLAGPKLAQSFTEGGPSALVRVAFRLSVALTALMMPLCLVLMIYGGSLLTLLYGAKYAGNSMVVSLLAINLLVSATAFTYSRALIAMEHADVDCKVGLLALFVLFALGVWLVRSFGPVGAAAGLLTASITVSILRYGAVAKLLHSAIQQKRYP